MALIPAGIDSWRNPAVFVKTRTVNADSSLADWVAGTSLADWVEGLLHAQTISQSPMQALAKREKWERLRKESLSCTTAAEDHPDIRPKPVNKTALPCIADLSLTQQG